MPKRVGEWKEVVVMRSHNQSRFPLAFFTVAAVMSYVNTFLNDNNVDGFGVSIKYPTHGIRSV